MLVQTKQVRSADDFPVSNEMLLFGNECANDKDFLQIFDSVSCIMYQHILWLFLYELVVLDLPELVKQYEELFQ